MKKLVLLLLLGIVFHTQGLMVMPSPIWAAPPALPQTVDHGGTIESKYDGFNHETVIALKKMRVTCGSNKSRQKNTCVSFAASLHAPGKQLDHVRYASLQIIFETKDWDRRHPLDQRELAIVVNGETIRLGRMGLVTQDISTDKLIEISNEVFQVDLPYKTFEKIAKAETVEMRVGYSEFVLQEKNLAALRDLNNRVRF
jgi:hypothetical protein